MEKKPKKKKVVKKKENESTIGKKLTLKQELFCKLYATNNEIFGNGTKCYAEAYGFDLDNLSKEGVYEDVWDEINARSIRKMIEDSPYDKARLTCQVNSSRLLSNAMINDRIGCYLRSLMTDDAADEELAWVMKQRVDLSPKVQALKEFNKLKGRIIDKKEVDVKGLSLKDLYELAKEE